MRLFGVRSLWLVLMGVVAGLTSEIVARLDDAARQGVPLLSSPSAADLTIHDSLGTRGRPSARYEKWRLNAAGFRGPEISNTPSDGCVRIAVMGASETFGYYERAGKEYPAQLADSLSRRGCFEVMNAGIPGMTLPGQIQLWDKWVARFRPAVVLIYVPPVFYLSADPPSFPTLTGGAPATVSHRFSPRVLDRLHDRLEYPEFLQRRRVARRIAAALHGKPEGWQFRTVPADRLELYGQHLDSLVTSVLASGAVPVLMTHAMRFADPPAAADSDLLLSWLQFTPRSTKEVLLDFERKGAEVTREIARRRGLPLVDVAGEMTGRNEWFADFTHFDEVGAGVAAGNIATVVERVAASRTPDGNLSRSVVNPRKTNRRSIQRSAVVTTSLELSK
jgi:hypothetical protein